MDKPLFRKPETSPAPLLPDDPIGQLFDLSGKIALVTGGSRGLGYEIVKAFAQAGADVVVTSRKLDACQQVANEVEALGRSALAHACHVGHWDEISALVDAAYARFGRVDILVNNAGMSPLAPSSPTSTHRRSGSTTPSSAGPFLTDIAKAWTPENRERTNSAIGHPGDPREIVTTALHLASPHSSYTTDALIRVDGGVP